MALRQDELKILEQALSSRAARLRSELADKLDQVAEDVEDLGASTDTGDHSFTVAETHLDRAEAQRDVEELHQIEAALAAIGDGSYGICVSCGNEIPENRLRAQPLALRCVPCQERIERGQR